jgi:hypothetical protein
MKKFLLITMALVLMTGMAASNIYAQEKPKTLPKTESKPVPARTAKHHKGSHKKSTKPAAKQEVKHKQAK